MPFGSDFSVKKKVQEMLREYIKRKETIKKNNKENAFLCWHHAVCKNVWNSVFSYHIRVHKLHSTCSTHLLCVILYQRNES